jgi:hypothetical protein
MKKLIALLVLLSPALMASSMYETIGDMTIQIREKLGYTTGSSNALSDSTAANFIREGVLTVSPLTKGKVVAQSVVTTYRTQNYTLAATTIGIEWVAWSRNDSTKSLLYVPRELWYQQEHKTTMGKSDFLKRPSYYDYSRDSVGMTLYLFPTPTLRDSVTDTIRVMTHQREDDLDTTTILTFLPEEHRAAVVKYATWKVAQARQHPLTEAFRQEYVEYIGIIRALDRGRPVEKTTD